MAEGAWLELEHTDEARPCEYVVAHVPCGELTTLRLPTRVDGPRPLCPRHGELVIAARLERALREVGR